MSDSSDPSDLLYGVPAIGTYMALTERQARHLCDNGTIPTFKMGKKVCSRRSMCNEVLQKFEAEARREALAQANERRQLAG